jgi:catechol 2,3-dioxygenase-like lactoylglutathione lyase family enzyme
MIQGLDHLVVVVRDLEKAAKDYEQLGFTVVPGGQHPVGSHNVLIAFEDGSYLEIIAFYREAVDHRWWDPLSKGERLLDFCFQTDDLRGDTKKLKDAGTAINDPVPWSRKRPDGYELKWLLSLATGSHRGVAPFLIEEVTPRTERIPQQFNHKNRVVGIDKVTVAVGDLAQADKWYSALLGVKGEAIAAGELGAEGLRFMAGPHSLEFVTPRSAASPLIDWLRTYGPSPYSAVLKSRGSPPHLLDRTLTHGANLFIA